MGRFFYPLVFLIAVTGFVLGGSIQATFFRPLKIPVHQVNPENSEEESNGEKKDKTFWERTTGDPIALYTLALTAFTGVLAWATYGLLRETKKLAELGADQAATANRSIALAAQQTDLIRLQHGLAREEYFASHRPRISVTRMSVDLSTNSPLKYTFVFVNNGEAVAKRCHWNAGVLLLSEPGAIHGNYSYAFNQRGVFSGPLAIGAGSIAQVTENKPLDSKDLDDIEYNRKWLHVVGTVVYEDNLGVMRTMGFFRYYDPVRRRFRVVDDPEYEYQD
jgi:hypothetical protein